MPERLRQREHLDRAERAAYLDRVAVELDLPPAMAHDVIEELAGHIDDEAEALRAGGLAAEDADRRAVGRLGDPAVLAHELGRARRGGRAQLALAGSGLWGALVEGTRASLLVAFAMLLAALVAIELAALILHAIGASTSSFFGGPLGSAATSLAVIGIFAYVGHVLPARVAPRTVRSVGGVRRMIAVGGLVLGSLAVWLVPDIQLDLVLAIGLPLAPLAFAITAWNAPDRPGFRLGLVSAVLLAGILVVPMTALALLTTTPSREASWMMETSAIGAAPEDVGIQLDQFGIDGSLDGAGNGVASVRDASVSGSLATSVRAVRVEVWPARLRNDVITLGAAPIAASATLPTTDMRAGQPVELRWSTPRLREPMTTATFVIGSLGDGRRVVLEQLFGIDPTPPWTGSPAAWWFGS